MAGKILAAMSAQLLTQKLVVKRGILFKEEKSIPLEKNNRCGAEPRAAYALFWVIPVKL